MQIFTARLIQQALYVPDMTPPPPLPSPPSGAGGLKVASFGAEPSPADGYFTNTLLQHHRGFVIA